MVAAVLLAAGAGSRFAGSTHKLLAPVAGEAILARSVGAAIDSGLDVFVVVGAVDLSSSLPGSVHVVENPAWAQGQASSVRAGIAAAQVRGHEAVVIGLADQPFVSASSWRAVAESDAPIAVATYDGRRGHPVRLASGVWDLLPTSGDEVGRAVMRDRPELVAEVPCTGDASDIDTVEDLRRWS